jgi:DNA ligase (NAD+)
MDGAVVKVDRLALWRQLGATAKAPRFAMAYKYSHEQAQTVLRAITLQVGRTGVLTPVAELEPVELAGSTIARATLHNEDEIRRKDIRVGDTVDHRKGRRGDSGGGGSRGREAAGGTEPFDCSRMRAGSARRAAARSRAIRKRRRGGARISDCPAQIRGRIEHFVSRKAMDIDGFGEAIIEALTSEVESPGEGGRRPVRGAHGRKDPAAGGARRGRSVCADAGGHRGAAAEPGGGRQEADDEAGAKLCAAIEASKGNELWRLIHGLGIPNVGEGLARSLAEELGSLDALMAADEEALAKVRDVGGIVARACGNSSGIRATGR